MENKTENKTVEAIKNGNKPSTQELFEMVNAYDITMLSIMDKNNKTLLEMDINTFESYTNTFEFRQLNTDTRCVIDQSDILSVETKYIEDEDMVHIKCSLPDDKKLNLVIFHVSTGQKLTVSDEYCEIGLYDLNEFLKEISGDKPEYTCSVVKVKNNFGFKMRWIYPKQVAVNMEDDETNGELCIEDDVNFLKIDVMDDSCNGFYRKDNDTSIEIMIKPYSEPFLEVRMFFEKCS